MRSTSFAIKSKAGSKNATPNKAQEVERAIRIARANSHLESTREQFEKNVLEVKRGLSPESDGVLAGPIARHR